MPGVIFSAENASSKMPDEDMSTRARIALEDEPHRAALEDNPGVVHVGSRTWASIGVSFILYVTTRCPGHRSSD